MKLLITILTFLILAGCSGKVSQKEPTRNVKTITPLTNNWAKLQNREKIDSYFRLNGRIYCGAVQYNEYPMKNVDTNTFEVYPSSKYARDKDNIYYPLSIVCVDGADWGVCFCDEYIVEGADPSTFKYLGNDYGSDKNYGYYRGVRIKDSHGETLKMLEGPEFFRFAADINNVYIGDEIFKEADPLTFKYDKGNPMNDTLIHHYIIKDTVNTWKFTPPSQIEKIK